MILGEALPPLAAVLAEEKAAGEARLVRIDAESADAKARRPETTPEKAKGGFTLWGSGTAARRAETKAAAPLLPTPPAQPSPDSHAGDDGAAAETAEAPVAPAPSPQPRAVEGKKEGGGARWV